MASSRSSIVKMRRREEINWNWCHRFLIFSLNVNTWACVYLSFQRTSHHDDEKRCWLHSSNDIWVMGERDTKKEVMLNSMRQTSGIISSILTKLLPSFYVSKRETIQLSHLFIWVYNRIRFHRLQLWLISRVRSDDGFRCFTSSLASRLLMTAWMKAIWTWVRTSQKRFRWRIRRRSLHIHTMWK